jgi:hypothetical protein
MFQLGTWSAHSGKVKCKYGDDMISYLAKSTEFYNTFKMTDILCLYMSSI